MMIYLIKSYSNSPFANVKGKNQLISLRILMIRATDANRNAKIATLNKAHFGIKSTLPC